MRNAALNADGTYSYTLFAAAQELAQGENVADSFSYTVSDSDGSDTGALVFHIAGVNDAPTANPDSETTGENAVLLVDVLANDMDIDNGAVPTATAASARRPRHGFRRRQPAAVRSRRGLRRPRGRRQ